MNIENLTIGEALQLVAMFSTNQVTPLPDQLIGSYVIVRCRDAGVHAGVLKSRVGRECVLTESRRLWYWKPAKGKWLSAVANHGLHECSKIGEPVALITLTENCEIIQCSADAEQNIRKVKSDE